MSPRSSVDTFGWRGRLRATRQRSGAAGARSFAGACHRVGLRPSLWSRTRMTLILGWARRPGSRPSSDLPFRAACERVNKRRTKRLRPSMPDGIKAAKTWTNLTAAGSIKTAAQPPIWGPGTCRGCSICADSAPTGRISPRIYSRISAKPYNF